MGKTAALAIVLVMLAVSGGACQAPTEIVSQPGQNALTTPALPVGVYQVTFRLQVDKTDSSVSPLATLQIDLPGYANVAGKTITAYNFAQAGTPTDFSFTVDNFAAQPISAWVGPTAGAATKLTVDRLSVAPRRQLCLGTVWPGKILYHTGEAAQGLVSVYNGADTPQTATLRCTLESEVSQMHPLSETALTLAPGERREIPLAWNTGKEEYGFALAATLVDPAGKTLSEGREYFSVADNLWKVCLTQAGRGCNPPSGPGPNESSPVADIKKAEDGLAAELAKPFVPLYWNYSNYMEYYAWSPDDFFNMAPAADYWYSGTGNYTMGKRHLQMAVKWLHGRGMRASAYLNPFTIGFGGAPVYAQHPEWFVYDQNGQLTMGSYYEKKLELASKPPDSQQPYKMTLAWYALMLNVNIATLEPVDAQVTQMVKAQKMFGWDAFRFDNATYSANGYDYWGKKIDGNDPARKDLLEARAWAHMRDSLWKQLGPDFPVGDNSDWQFREARGAAAWDESCRKGQLLMEEVPRSSYDPTSPTNRWADFMAYYHKTGEVVRGLGGHHLIIGFDVQYPIDHLFMTIFTYAGRSHPYGNYHADTLPLGNYAQFVTRYSSLMWDIDRVKALPDPEQRLTVKSERPVWWKEYASVRTAPDGARQYLVHLVNAPVTERIHTDATDQVPAPQKDVTVTLTLNAGEKLTRATLLTADPVMSSTVLPLAVQGNQATVTVPNLYFWDLLVLE
ncbi:MAG TPA: glycoside hydrolase family 66 protein [Armatimonadota bacterium]|jgi:hypothetical protein